MKGQTMKKRASLILKIAAIVFLIIRLGGYVVADKRGKDFANQSTKNEGAKRMYKKLTTNMMVEDVNRTVDFYSDVLGFEFVMGVPQDSQEIVTAKQKGQPLGFAIVKCGDVEMMFQTRKSLAEEIPEFNGMKIGGSLTFYVEVENIEGLYVKLKDKVTIIKDIQTTFYGKREFYLRDCNGYILIFAGDV
ncbi:MAG: VOC family protein [Planctomycetota bacterium]|jgi:uncharacterized glyoxalase superfamily protein PhnB